MGDLSKPAIAKVSLSKADMKISVVLKMNQKRFEKTLGLNFHFFQALYWGEARGRGVG